MAGHAVTAIDFSPIAVEHTKKALPEFRDRIILGDFFAYEITGGSNLDLPDAVFAPDGRELSLEKDIYMNFDIILCISTYSATAPLTAFAKSMPTK